MVRRITGQMASLTVLTRRRLLRRNMCCLAQSRLCSVPYANSVKVDRLELDMSPTDKHETSVVKPWTFPSAAVVKRNLIEYKKGARICAQGDASKYVLYIQQGGVRISVVNKGGTEAVIGMLGPADVFGETYLTGLPFRMSTATAIIGTKVLVIEMTSKADPRRCFPRYLKRRSPE